MMHLKQTLLCAALCGIVFGAGAGELSTGDEATRGNDAVHCRHRDRAQVLRALHHQAA